MSNSIYQFAQETGPAIHWRLRRNCSVTPAQLGWLYLSLCALSLGIGVFFALYFATDNAKIEAIMHSLNSMAGIRKYRIHDELPITFSSEDTLLEAVSARGEESEKLKEKRSLCLQVMEK